MVGAGGRSLTFIATGEPLAADTYTVALRSADNGLKDTTGNLLDGDADGTPGADFSDTFIVPPSSVIEIGLRDFVRGPGQDVNLPADSTDGIPITISDGASVRNASFAIDYNSGLLNITGIMPGANMPAGSTATVDTSTPGRAVVTLTSPTDLASRT